MHRELHFFHSLLRLIYVCFTVLHAWSHLNQQDVRGHLIERTPLTIINYFIFSELQAALREGTVKLHITKCGVSGPPGTGKSHVRALMLGKPRPTARQSTAEADWVITNLNRIPDEEDLIDMRRTGSSFAWKVIGNDMMARLIANTVHNRDYSSVKE